MPLLLAPCLNPNCPLGLSSTLTFSLKFVLTISLTVNSLFWFLMPWSTVCRIFAPWPGIEPMYPALWMDCQGSPSQYVIPSKVKVSRKDSLWLTWQQKSEPTVIHGCDFLTQCCGCGHCSRITSSLLWRCQRNGQQVNWLSQKDHYDSGQQSLWSF